MNAALPSLQVLIVDDEPLVAAGHAGYVARIDGFQVVGTVGTVQAAIRALASLSVDLVLLDLNLPDGNGLDIVRQIRAAGRQVDTLAITAAREQQLVRSAVALGVIGYLLKPFTFADMRERMAAYRRYREQLSGADTISQSRVDALIRELHQPPDAAATAPKGVSPELLERVICTLRAGDALDGLSASEVAAATGTSRVTARRYLQHLAETGSVDRSQKLGGSGRPEITFRWRLP